MITDKSANKMNLSLTKYPNKIVYGVGWIIIASRMDLLFDKLNLTARNLSIFPKSYLHNILIALYCA